MVMVSDERHVNTHHLCKTHDGSDKDYLTALTSVLFVALVWLRKNDFGSRAIKDLNYPA
jgi:hypothetical protein